MGENKYGTLSFFENTEFDNLNREFLNGPMQNKTEEEKGLIQKAIGYSKKGAENFQKGFKATLDKANFTNTNNININGSGYPGSSSSTKAETESVFSSFSNFSIFNHNNNNNSSQGQNKPVGSFYGVTTLLSYKNFPVFCVLFGVSVMFFVLAFLTLPMIVIAPRQFGLFFTLASISFVSSLAFLKGFSNFYFHLVEKNRLPFTLAYIISLICTFYFTVTRPIYLLALVTSVVQVLALISFLITYISGGANAIKMILGAIYSYGKGLFRKGDSDLPF